MLPKLLDVDVVIGRALDNCEVSKDPPIPYRSRNAEIPASEEDLDADGVVDVDLKCSVFATSLTSYSSEMVRVLEDARECDLGVAPGVVVGVFQGVGFLTAIVSEAIPTSIKTGWFVKAPINALHPAPCVTRMITRSVSSSSESLSS